MVKPVYICTAGECGGECYACRLRAVAAERERYRTLAFDYLDRLLIVGAFGPWSDGWTDEHAHLAREREEQMGAGEGAAA